MGNGQRDEIRGRRSHISLRSCGLQAPAAQCRGPGGTARGRNHDESHRDRDAALRRGLAQLLAHGIGLYKESIVGCRTQQLAHGRTGVKTFSNQAASLPR
jgi:hypothetical protein